MSRRLTLFAKGNLDLRDSLIAHRADGTLAWNGINTVLAERHPGWRARVRHETCSRHDMLPARPAPVPTMLADRRLPLGAYPAAGQFATALFDGTQDATILSLQPDLMTTLARHRGEGWLFHPHGHAGWPEADRRWLAESFTVSPPPTAEMAMASLEAVVARLRARTAAPVLVCTVPAAVAGEWVHDHAGQPESYATRIRRFNLALVDLSRRIGLSIVDVDAIVAREGARHLTIDPLHLNAHGCRLVAEEVVRVLDDLGCFGDDGPCR